METRLNYVYNNHGYFDSIIPNLHKQAMIQLHSNSLVSFALPKILREALMVFIMI